MTTDPESGLPMKYATLSELIAAYRAGEIPEGECLVIDSFDCYLYAGPEGERVCLWRANKEQLINEALALLGVPITGA